MVTDTAAVKEWTYQQRIDALRATKLAQTREKQELIGSMDHDDWAVILPPPERRKVVQRMGPSGLPITDCLLAGFEAESNHPSGGFFGPAACGRNFRRLLEQHPPYVDPLSSLAGAYMVNFGSYRKVGWNPDFDYSHLRPEQKLYKLVPGIGAAQHFCQDLNIGLAQGWGGILERIRRSRAANPARAEFLTALEDVALGMQSWIGHNAEEAARLAGQEAHPQLRQNLLETAEINHRLVTEPPRTFREACQWILWFDMAARMYNGSGSLGKLDLLLWPFYQRDRAAGILTDEEAIFHLACLLLRDTAYIQLGGPGADGKDVTNPVSYLTLEAAHRLRIPANVGVCVGQGVDPGLLRRGVEILCQDRTGIPKFLGVENTIRGFMRNGYPAELARQRAYSGCHWSAIPGREYTLNDCVKINFAAVFEVALKEMMGDGIDRISRIGTADCATPANAARSETIRPNPVNPVNPVYSPSVAELWQRFERHLRRAVEVIAEGLDFHLAHMEQVAPELVLDLLCHGTIEKGRDASNGGVEFYNLCVDGAALATVADSFAAIEQRIEKEHRLTWAELKHFLETDWACPEPGRRAGPEGEQARLMMKSIPRYGSGGSRADEWAVRIVQAFTAAVKAHPTPGGRNMIPGLFSWANTIPMGKELGATPNGRHAGAPISHGANPDPGFRKDGAPTALAVAIASVQPGYGNTAPMQIEIDPALSRAEDGVEKIMSLLKTHFDLGGTQININIMDAAQVLEAHKDPSKYPDLVVRVTGFSAYFASLSPAFRQLVVDRIISES